MPEISDHTTVIPLDAAVFVNLKKFLDTGGTLSGLTIPGKDARGGLLHKPFNKFYNKCPYFCNREVNCAGLGKNTQ